MSDEMDDTLRLFRFLMGREATVAEQAEIEVESRTPSRPEHLPDNDVTTFLACAVALGMMTGPDDPTFLAWARVRARRSQQVYRRLQPLYRAAKTGDRAEFLRLLKRLNREEPEQGTRIEPKGDPVRSDEMEDFLQSAIAYGLMEEVNGKYRISDLGALLFDRPEEHVTEAMAAWVRHFEHRYGIIAEQQWGTLSRDQLVEVFETHGVSRAAERVDAYLSGLPLYRAAKAGNGPEFLRLLREIG